MTAFSAVLLAAGESRRMGDINKLELPVGDTPLLRRSAEVLLKSGLQEVVVVVGHQEETARKLVSGLPVKTVTNENYREGQMTSVHRGMSALHWPCDAVFVCLSDLPLIETADLREMMEAYEDCESSVMVPTYQGQRGNPIILDHSHRQAILDGDRNLGCKRLIEKNPELVTAIEMDNDHVVFDLDTPEAYQQLLDRLDTTTPSSVSQSA